MPCRYMKPILSDMSKAYTGKALVMAVDMDANKGLVRDFSIRMMPTQVFLTPEGKEFFRNEGTFEREQIAQVFAKMGVSGPAQGAAPAQVTPAGPICISGCCAALDDSEDTLGRFTKSELREAPHRP